MSLSVSNSKLLHALSERSFAMQTQTLARLILMAAVNAGLVLAGEPQVANAASSQDSPALEFAVVRQGASQTRLTDRPQKVLFVKSQATDAKAAIGNLLLSDVGLTLITKALAPQLRMWNPYMNDSIRKGIDLGKGMLIGHGSDTKGFEYDTLPGATAAVTLKEGTAEFLVPMNTYVPDRKSTRLNSSHLVIS